MIEMSLSLSLEVVKHSEEGCLKGRQFIVFTVRGAFLLGEERCANQMDYSEHSSFVGNLS